MTDLADPPRRRYDRGADGRTVTVPAGCFRVGEVAELVGVTTTSISRYACTWRERAGGAAVGSGGRHRYTATDVRVARAWHALEGGSSVGPKAATIAEMRDVAEDAIRRAPGSYVVILSPPSGAPTAVTVDNPGLLVTAAILAHPDAIVRLIHLGAPRAPR